MKYTEILEELKKRGAGKIQPFVPFADWHDHENGFVVLPDGLQMEQVATNQNNQSAKKLSEEAKKMLENVVKMATKEENWGAIPELFKGESND